jgi:hypothetical protein
MPQAEEGDYIATENPVDIFDSGLIVEIGSGAEYANAYIGFEYIGGYFHGERLAQWNALTDGEKVNMIISATQYVDISYKWLGKRLTQKQGLSFPRSGITLDDFSVCGVPVAVKKAVAETVWLLMQDSANGGDGLFSQETNGDISSEQVGPLRVSYFDKKIESEQKDTPYDILNMLLRGLYQVNSGSGGINNVSAVRT